MTSFRFILGLLFLVAGPFTPAVAGEKAATIQIAHFGNLDGAFDAVACRAEDRGRVNYAHLVSTLDDVGKQAPTLVLSSGNVIGDAPFFDFLLRQGDSGIATFAAMLQASQVARLVPGLGEFSVPYRMFQEFLPDFSESKVAYGAANVSGTGRGKSSGDVLSTDAVLVHRVGDVTVAVIPLVGPQVAAAVHPVNIAGLTFKAPHEVLNTRVSGLRRAGADVVVALVNLEGRPGDSGATIEFVRQLRGVDLVIAGGLTPADEVEPVIDMARVGPQRTHLIGSPRAPDAVGVVTLRLTRRGEDWRRSAVESAIRRVSSFRKDESVDTILSQAAAEFCSIGQRTLGEASPDEPLTTEALIDYILEILRRGRKTDLAMLSIDSLRGGDANALDGPVTAGFLSRSLSRHEVVVLSVLGRDLKAFVAGYFSAGGTSTRQRLRVSGARLLKDGTVEINDRPIHVKRRYTIATSDFLASGGKHYLTALTSAPTTRQSPTQFFLREVVHRYFDQTSEAITIDVEKDFPALWQRPLWEFNVSVNGAVSNVSIDNPGAYAETQLTSRSPNTGVKGDGQFHAVMSTRDHRVSEFFKAQYGMVEIGDGGFDETQDLITQELQYSWTRWRNQGTKGRFWVPAPQARAKLETEFSKAPKVFQKDDDGNVQLDTDGTQLLAYDPYHHLEITAVAGFEWLFGARASAGIGYGVRSELLATPGSNLQGWHTGLEFYYQINQLPLYSWSTTSGLTLDSRFELFFSDLADEQTLKSSGSTKLVASVLGPLSFTLGFDLFVYRTGDSGLAYAFDTMAGLSFSYDAALQQF